MNDKRQYRTVLITGGTRGIGRACVEAFALAGFRVAFCYKNSTEIANDIVSTCQQNGAYVISYQCDVSDSKQVLRMYDKIKIDFGFVDTVVNNAGVSHFGEFNRQSESDYNLVLDINFKSVFNVCKLFSQDMISECFGRIINVSSIWGQRGASMESLYSCSKGAVDTLTKSLAKEFAPSGVTVNAVSPGFINTDMNREVLSQNECDEFIKSIPLMRAGEPYEVAQAILFLANESSSYITGEIIKIAGGLNA